MSPNINEFVLSGYEKLTENGFASPVFTKAKKGNLRYRGLSQLDVDYQYRISGFEEIETDTNYFEIPEELQIIKRVSNIWTDVFIWDGEIYIGSRKQISQSIEDFWEQIKQSYPLSMIDLIEDVSIRDQCGLIQNALKYLSERYDEEKALNWMSGIYIRNELMKSYQVTLLNLGATSREIDAVGRIEVDRDGAEMSILIPKVLVKYQINPAKLPRVSYALSSLKKSVSSVSLQMRKQSTSASDIINSRSDRLSLPFTNSPELSIIVVGVGGAGGNAVNNMITSGLSGVEYLVVNTDEAALNLSIAEKKLPIGTGITHGIGAGMRPEIGEKAAIESLGDIISHVENADMIFLVGGMGGGTATGAMSVIAQAAKNQDILTVACITKPFDFEGTRRKKIAERGIQKLFSTVDTIITIPNQNLFRDATEKTTMSDAFDMADEVLFGTVKMMTDLMVAPGLINIDFEDVQRLIESMGNAVVGLGAAEGKGRALAAAQKAITNPLLDDYSISSARGVLINITGGRDLTLYEVDEAASYIRSSLNENTNIIVGSALDETLYNAIRVTILATGVHSSSELAELASKPTSLATGELAKILTIRDNMCKWPIGDPSTAHFRFCGRKTVDKDEPYCTAHSKLAYQPSRRRGEAKNVVTPFKQRKS